MTGCRRACGHRQLVTDYHVAREAALLAREAATRGHHDEGEPILTFRDWLVGLGGRHDERD